MDNLLNQFLQFEAGMRKEFEFESQAEAIAFKLGFALALKRPNLIPGKMQNKGWGLFWKGQKIAMGQDTAKPPNSSPSEPAQSTRGSSTEDPLKSAWNRTFFPQTPE